MYLSARVIKDISSCNNAWKYMDWIFRFFRQILEIFQPLQRAGLAARLGGLHDLVNLAFLISGTATGYSLLKRCVTVLLRLAALNSTLWYNDSTISIPEGIANPRYEITQFIIYDTIIALSLGTPPLLHYNTTPSWVDEAPGHYQIMYGFPVGVLLLLAKVNEWRTSRIAGRVSQSQSDWCGLEERLNNWHPTVYHTDGPNNNIARLAIQEAWRQAAMIYLYMGMREVNSADPRVEAAVQQIAQLVGIFKTGSVLELHLLVPYLIAGIAARRETHRAVLRSKLTGEMVRKVYVFIIRGSDFAAVLDHLWHGVGSQGRPVTWDNYVQSPCAVLPVV